MITNYTLYRGTNSNVTTPLFEGYSGGTSWVDTNVTVGTKYYYIVSAVNAAGEGPRSNEQNATPYAAPNAPILIAKDGVLKILLSWTLPINNGASITYYSIYRGATSTNETLFIKGYAGGTSWVDTNVSTGTKYYYMVSAVNVAGEGPRSNEQDAIAFTVPSAPNPAIRAGSLKIILSWTTPSSNGAPITNYSIYRGTTSNSETLFVKGYIGGISWVDTNISVGTKYYYMVSAVNAAGEGPRSNETSITAGGSPSIPIGLTSTGGDSQVLLRWSAPKSGGKPDHYNIYRSESKTGNYSLIGVASTTKYKDTGLTNGQEYWYKINAQNDYGVSANTTITSTTPYETSIISIFILVIIVIIIVVLIIVEATRSSRKKKPNHNLQSKKRDGPV